MNMEPDLPVEGTPLIRPSTTDHPLYDAVVDACRTVYDPEIPVNIYDLGLVYTIAIADDGDVTIAMTLTAPGCPVAGEMPGWVVDALEGQLLEGHVIEVMRTIYDPEIPVNIYELGLVYETAVDPENAIGVRMTLTTPNCPVAESMPGEVELRVGSVPGVGHAEVELVWDPPWTPERMSEEAKLELNMY